MTTPAPDPATEHASSLASLVALLVAELRKLWAPLESGATSEIPRDAVKALVTQYAITAGLLGAEFYDAARRDAGVRGRFRAVTPDAPPSGLLDAAVGWSAKSLHPKDSSDPLRVDEGFAQLAGAMQKVVRDSDRAAIAHSVTGDQKAAGWVRVATGEHTCSFCILMVIRGPVYKSRDTAGAGPNSRFHGEGEFKFHNNDDCIVLPVFDRGSWQPSQQILDWEKRYYDATSHVSGAEKRRAFRRAVEGADMPNPQ